MTSGVAHRSVLSPMSKILIHIDINIIHHLFYCIIHAQHFHNNTTPNNMITERIFKLSLIAFRDKPHWRCTVKLLCFNLKWFPTNLVYSYTHLFCFFTIALFTFVYNYVKYFDDFKTSSLSWDIQPLPLCFCLWS